MIVLGLLLLLVVGVAALAAATRGGDSVSVDLEWFSLKADAGIVFFAGATAMLLLVLGCWLLVHGLRRSRHRRSEMKALRKRAEHSEEQAQRERAAAAPSSDAEPQLADGADESFDSAPRDT